MGAAEKIREILHHYIDQMDDRMLRVVHAMIEAYNDEIVGSEPNGTLLKRSDLTNRALSSEEDIKEGRVIKLEDLEKDD